MHINEGKPKRGVAKCFKAKTANLKGIRNYYV